jgi:hypothetical protein
LDVVPFLRFLAASFAALGAVPLGVGFALLLVAGGEEVSGKTVHTSAANGVALFLTGAVAVTVALYCDLWLSRRPRPQRTGFQVRLIASPDAPDWQSATAARADDHGPQTTFGDWRRARWLSLTLVGVVAVGAASVAVPVAWWVAGLNERLRLADGHASVVRQQLEADPRFSGIDVESFTGGNGTLLVTAVAQPGTAQDLRRIVESTSPPVPVIYEVVERTAGPVPRDVKVNLNALPTGSVDSRSAARPEPPAQR